MTARAKLLAGRAPRPGSTPTPTPTPTPTSTPTSTSIPTPRAGHSVFSSIARTVSHRLSPGGRLALIITAFGAGFGVDTTLSLASTVFSLGLALLLVAFAATVGRAPRVRATRRAGRVATVGVPFEYEIELRNTGHRPLIGASLRDELDTGPVRARVRRPRSFFPRLRRAIFDRAADRRWQRGGAIVETPCPDLAAGASVRIVLSFVPERRGALQFDRVAVFAPEPLGLARAIGVASVAGRLVVLPPRYPVPMLALPGGKRLQRGGVANAGKVGDAEEFLGLRDYRPGDPLRRIAWKRTARVGRPIVRENEDEFFVRQGIVLDTFCPPERADLLDAATSVAASIATTLVATPLARDALLDLVLVENRAYRLSAGRGTGGVEALLEVIAAARPAPPAGFATLAAAAADCASTASALILVLLDWDAARRSLVHALLASGSAIVPIVVTDDDALVDADALAAGVKRVRPTRLAADLAAL